MANNSPSPDNIPGPGRTMSRLSLNSATTASQPSTTQQQQQQQQQHQQAPSSQHTPLTQVLMESSPFAFELATQAPFLVAAGRGKVPKATLSRWLSQDRLYAQAYISFVGALIARVDLPYASVEDKSTSLRWRIVHMLTSALSNIHKELDFFASTAKRYGLDLDCPPNPQTGDDNDSNYSSSNHNNNNNSYGGPEPGYFTALPATKGYVDLFRAFAYDPTMSLLEGLVVLWATEQCYLSAWRHAALGLSHPDSRRENDLDGGALRQEFIPNWTSPEFEKFVADIADLTNLLAEREDAWKRIDVYKAVWAHILGVETKFWPAM